MKGTTLPALPLLFARSPQPMYVFDPETLRFLDVNAAALKLYGYRRGQFLRLKLTDIAAPEIRATILPAVRSLGVGLTDLGLRRHIRKDGTRLWVQVSTQRVRMNGGQIQLSVLRDVTQERALEAQLRQSRERLAAVLESAPQAIFALDREGRILFTNRSRPESDPHKAVGKPLVSFLNAEARPVWRRKLREVFRAGRTVTFETFYDRRGEPTWYSNRVAPVVDDGKVVSAVCVATDVTERKSLEDELSGSERYWRELLAQSPDYIGIFGRDLRLRYVNRLPAGLDMAMVLDSSVLDFLAPEHRAEARSVFRRVFRSAKPKKMEMRAVGDEGRLAWYSATVAPLVRGERVEELVLVGRDITEDKTLRSRFESMFLSSKDAINYTAIDGTLLDVNPAYERLTGYTREELIGAKRFYDMTPPEYHASDRAKVVQLIETGEPVEFEKETLRRDGRRVPVSLTAFCVRGPSGRVEGLAAVLRDISERRRLEREILEAGAREQSKLGRDLHDSLGQTIAGIALLAKGLRSRLAGRRGPETQDATRLAELSSHAVRQVRGMARGLLPSELQSAGLGEALEELANNAQELFGIRCRLECPQGLRLPDESTAVQLYRIAQEAVHNAAKHANARKDVVVRVQLLPRRVLRLSISDDGVGIPAEAGRRKGLGLGIMAHRARMLGAKLTVRRRPRGGTEVVCDCPCPSLHGKA